MYLFDIFIAEQLARFMTVYTSSTISQIILRHLGFVKEAEMFFNENVKQRHNLKQLRVLKIEIWILKLLT
jgi:hypothetical protein